MMKFDTMRNTWQKLPSAYNPLPIAKKSNNRASLHTKYLRIMRLASYDKMKGYLRMVAQPGSNSLGRKVARLGHPHESAI